MMEAELLTTFQEVAIVDEVTVIKDKRPLVVWIRTPRSRLATSKLRCCLVLRLILGSTCSMGDSTAMMTYSWYWFPLLIFIQLSLDKHMIFGPLLP
jgi:hypothetical protein